MKLFIRTVLIGLLMVLFLSSVSCVVLTRHDNGKHKGWFKNPNNHPGKKSMGHVRFGKNPKTIKVVSDFGEPYHYSSELNIKINK